MAQYWRGGMACARRFNHGNMAAREIALNQKRISRERDRLFVLVRRDQRGRGRKHGKAAAQIALIVPAILLCGQLSLSACIKANNHAAAKLILRRAVAR